MEVDDSLSVQRPRASSFSFGRRLAEAANVVGKVTQSVGEVITRTAASAGELLVDSELRWKGTTKFLTEAQRGVQHIQKGVGELPGRIGQKLQQGAVNAMQQGFKAGGRPVQIVQRVIAKQLAELQRYNQLSSDSQPLVDIQIGPQVYEDMPQEMRSRLWYVILEDSQLVEPLRPLHRPNSVASARFSYAAAPGDSLDLIAPPSTPINTPHTPHTPIHPQTPYTPCPTPAGSTANSKPSSPGHRHASSHSTSATDTNEIELSVFAPSTPDAEACSSDPFPSSPFMAPGATAWAATPPPRTTHTISSSEQPHASTAPATGGDLKDLTPSTSHKQSTSHVTNPRSRLQNNTADLINLDSPQSSIEPPKLMSRFPMDSPVLLGSPIVPPHRSVDLLSAEIPAKATASSAISCDQSAGAHLAGPATPMSHAGAVNQAVEAPSTSAQCTGQQSEGLYNSLAVEVPSGVEEGREQGRDGDESVVLVSPTESMAHAAELNRTGCEVHPLAAIPCDSPQLSATPGRQARQGREEGVDAQGEWEMVPSSDGKFHDGMQEGQLARHCIKRISVEGDEVYRMAVSELKEAMSLVPWPIPREFDPECKFATLNNITLGQEEVDEVIYRDINRTFPEHPYFGEREGQMCLFRILKAYSLHDLEVGYCQGMAFVAGILLMYLPEEPAFRLFCRLMSEEGPNMRRLYLPGLEPLKVELARLEHLLLHHMPDLHAHLHDYGIPAVLYASQWFLTSYSCPFPHTFAARVLDIMLQDDDDKIIQRVALSIMKECQKQLLQLDDFEAIITCLKVTPVKWPQHHLRKVLNNALAGQITDQELEEALQAATIETAKLTREASTRHRRTASLQRLPSSVHASAAGAAVDAASSSSSSLPSGIPLPPNPPPLIPTAAGRAGPSSLSVPDIKTDGALPDIAALEIEDDSLLDDEPLEEQFLNMIFLPGELDSVDIEADDAIDAVFGP